ncbi:MAG: hypothetical protein JKY88_06555 [Pseudomonadales bacterium]|nr:hypothetical protein [Pseudomonadales bacterium]
MRLIFAALLLFPTIIWACSIPPQTLYQSNEQLVRSTPVITLAKVENREGDGKYNQYEFTFKSTLSLKGKAPDTFILIGYEASNVSEAPADFGDHKKPEFWAFDSGNTIQPGDCTAYGLFSVGQEYLIFLRPKSHYRSYENIKQNDDLWLEVVQLLIEYEKRQPY